MAERVIWITPSEVDGPQRSYERVTQSLGPSADVLLKALEVWDVDPQAPYDLQVEVEGVVRLAVHEGLDGFHLFGFSAGATVALAVALRLGEAVESVAVFEPATIGDDDWAAVERTWRTDMARVCNLFPVEARRSAFAQMMLPADAPALTAARNTSPWTTRTDLLEGMLAHVGFLSSDLAAITAPCLVITGGQSHRRFAHLAERLLTVMPNAHQAAFPDRSHLSPPMREEPARVAELLSGLWATCIR